MGVGSVGEPHDGPGACYALYDSVERRSSGAGCRGARQEEMIVGFVQFNPVRYDVAANIAQIERLLAGVRADLLVLPELANSGYMYATPDGPRALHRAGRRLRSLPDALRAWREDGGRHRHRIGRARRGRAVQLGRRGRAPPASSVYRKTHLFFEEQDLFLPGDTGFGVFEHAGAAASG